MPIEPVLNYRHEDARAIPLLVWRLPRPMLAVTSAPLGGGIGVRGWVINATVPMSYRRDDPNAHLADLADQLDLPGPGVGMLTGVDVAEVVAGDDAGVRLWATVGLGSPIWAAAEEVKQAEEVEGAAEAEEGAAEAAERAVAGVEAQVGTVNIVAHVPVRLSDAALVNAVATITEAKAQAMWELGLEATGTSTDAVTVLCRTEGAAAAYGGPRSAWGARLARATHRAVRIGGASWTAGAPWSERHAG